MAHVGLGGDEHFSDSGDGDGFCVKLGQTKFEVVELKVQVLKRCLATVRILEDVVNTYVPKK